MYTFEPNPDMFACLVQNAPSRRIIKIPCALGDSHDMVHMEKGIYGHNMGAWWIEPGGDIPVLMLDDFNFPCLDLIYLDIEGHEPQALKGAERTIEKHHPLVVVEYKKQILERCGTVGWLEDWMGRYQYERVGQVGRDVVMAHV